MASAPKKTAGENMPSVPFSYAQAAKGISSTPSPSAAPSKVPSESTTPSKALSAANSTPLDTPNTTPWADDVDSKIPKEDVAQSLGRPLHSPTFLEDLNGPEHANGTADPLSPEPSLSTSSTFVKDDDTSSVHNASSESTWENKSTTSQSGGKPHDRNESQGKKGKKRDRDPSKPQKASKDVHDQNDVPAPAPLPVPLHDAPIPSVNIWKQRAEEAKGKSSTQVKPPAEANPNVTTSSAPSNRSTSFPSAHGAAKEVAPSSSKKEKGGGAAGGSRGAANSSSHDKPSRSSSLPNGNASLKTAQHLPPVGNQELWPTPEIAKDDERRKAQEKADKGEKERPAATRSHGKNEWKPVEYTPSVVFNTPVPLLNARRGGRGGGRGGKEGNTRAASSVGGGSGSNEKDEGSLNTAVNGESSKRESSKTKRASSADAQVTSHGGDRSAGASTTSIAEKDGHTHESGTSTRQGAGNQHNAFPRSNTGSKQRQNKKPDLSVLAERRTGGSLMSPLRTSGSTQSEHNPLASPAESEPERKIDSITEGHSGSRTVQSDRRSNASVSMAKADRGESRPRGGIRGGRNGSQGSQHAHNQSRNIRNAGPRAQSIPTDQGYGRYFNGYGPPPAGLTPLQTYVSSMYDQYTAQPMSAVQYNRYVDTNSLIDMVTMQLDYYFSLDNLIKDTWLRKHMDSQGYVFLAVIANFNRLKHLTTDLEIIKLCCYKSSKIEYKVGTDGIDRIRVKDGWEQWVLISSERVAASQNDGPDVLLSPPPPRPQMLDPFGAVPYPVAPMTAGPEQTAQFSPFHSPNPNGIAPAHRASYPTSSAGPPNGTIHPAVRSPNGESVNATPPEPSTVQPASEADDFHDEQINFLTVIVRKQELDAQQPPPLLAESRTFSNGSLDSHSLKDESQTSPKSASPLANGVKPIREQATSTTERDAPSRSGGSESSRGSMNFFWVKEKETPVDILPQNATNEAYMELRSKALIQRQNSPLGSCPYDMDVLYQFWSHFLIRNFNTRMYNDFRHLAFEDNRERASEVGLKNLLKYYDQALNSDRTIRERIARHYVELVKSEMVEPDRPGYRQLRAAWRNGALNMRNRKRITFYVDADLKAALES